MKAKVLNCKIKYLNLIRIVEYNRMLKKYFTILLIIIISSCQNYSRTAIDKLSGNASTIKIVVLKPDVKLYEVDAMGDRIIKADWTNQAKKNVEIAMREFLKNENLNVNFLETELNEEQSQYLKLQKKVSDVIVGHVVVPEQKIPSKDIEGLDWTLGPKFSQSFQNIDADYVLILNIRDYFSTGGRILAQTLLVLLGGTYIPLIQQGYGTLIDVRTGDLVWFDFAQAESFGDTRNEKGAKDAIEKILKKLPKT